ncbi:MAG TPA: hypothetical protein VKZ89_09455 [Thermobifida alba]|nr:hypothetical protein [Thermobifida alba]
MTPLPPEQVLAAVDEVMRRRPRSLEKAAADLRRPVMTCDCGRTHDCNVCKNGGKL